MPEFIDVFHCTRQEASFYHPGHLHRFLQSLAVQGYYLDHALEEQEDASEPQPRDRPLEHCSQRPGQSDLERPFVPGVAPALWQEGERFLHGGIASLPVVV